MHILCFYYTFRSLLKTVVSPDTNETKLQYAEWSPVNNELVSCKICLITY